MIDISNRDAVKRDGGAMAQRMGWELGQIGKRKVVYRPGMPPRFFTTWLEARTWLRQIVLDIDTARARRAAQDALPPMARIVPAPIPVARRIG